MILDPITHRVTKLVMSSDAFEEERFLNAIMASLQAEMFPIRIMVTNSDGPVAMVQIDDAERVL